MTSYYHLLLFSLTFLPPIISDLSGDRAALLRLQTAVRGRTLGWNTTATTPCSWHGVTCNTTTNRVTWLRLPGSGLRGPLPENSVGNLTELQVLSLRGNSLSGELPADLASCTRLEEIHLQGNNFSGEIPASFFTLTNLARVNLAGNRFSGNIPAGFDNLINLRTLFLESNNFTGKIPDWNSLNRLRNLNVSFNGLMGSIPSTLSSFNDQSFMGTSLCGGPLGSCSSENGSSLSGGAIAGIVIGSFVLLLLLLLILLVSWNTYRKLKILPQTERSTMPPLEQAVSNQNSSFNYYSESQSYNKAIKNRGSDGLVFFGEYVEVFTLEELLTSSAEAIGKGKGSVGSTYKAYFESGVEVIVKRLKNVCVSEAEFMDRIEEVGSMVHEKEDEVGDAQKGKDKEEEIEEIKRVLKWKKAREARKNVKETERDEWGVPKSVIPVLYPQRFMKKKLDEKFAKFLDVFKQLHINIPFYDALEQMPNYTKFLKDLIAKRRRVDEPKLVQLNHEVSALVHKALPPKLKDPGSFTILCDIGNGVKKGALCNLGASINLIPLSLFKKLEGGELQPTMMTLKLSDRSITRPQGVVEDVLVKVGDHISPADFVVLDMEEDEHVPLILGRPFLAMAGMVLDVANGKITLKVDDKEVKISLYKTMKYPKEDERCHSIDAIDTCVEDTPPIPNLSYIRDYDNPSLNNLTFEHYDLDCFDRDEGKELKDGELEMVEVGKVEGKGGVGKKKPKVKKWVPPWRAKKKKVTPLPEVKKGDGNQAKNLGIFSYENKGGNIEYHVP